MGTFMLWMILTLNPFLTEGKHILSNVGPYDVVFRSLLLCPPEESGEDKIHVHLIPTYDRKTRLPTFTGNVTLKTALDDNLGVLFDFASSDPVAGWKRHAYIFPVGAAETALKKYLPDLTAHVLENIDGGPYALPLPPGTYTFTRKTLNGFGASFRKVVPVFEYGEYRIDFTLYDIHKNRNAVKGCFRVFGAAIPKL